jgi:hypothetical protein
MKAKLRQAGWKDKPARCNSRDLSCEIRFPREPVNWQGRNQEG